MEDKKELIKNEEVPIKNLYGTSTGKGYAPGGGNMEASYQQNIMRGEAPSQPPPKDYLIMSILVTIFCCLPCGVVGIVKSTNARTMYAVGSFQAAEMTSQSAGTWTKAGLICGILFWVLYAIFMIVYVVVVLEAEDWDD